MTFRSPLIKKTHTIIFYVERCNRAGFTQRLQEGFAITLCTNKIAISYISIDNHRTVHRAQLTPLRTMHQENWCGKKKATQDVGIMCVTKTGLCFGNNVQLNCSPTADNGQLHEGIAIEVQLALLHLCHVAASACTSPAGWSSAHEGSCETVVILAVVEGNGGSTSLRCRAANA